MNKLFLSLSCLSIGLGVLVFPTEVNGQRTAAVRRPVPVKLPVVLTKVVLRPGHPVRRPFPATVVVRPARRVVAVGRPAVFLSPVVWAPVVVVQPPSAERLVWQDSETISKEEGWVDTNFGVDGPGKALFLGIDGKSKLNFAEISFANGNVQVIDFNEKTREAGVYNLLDFADGRHVSTVRLLAKSEMDETKLTVYLGR